MSNKFFGDLDDSAPVAESVVEVDVTTEEVAESEPEVESVDVVVDNAEADLTHTALGIHLTPRGRYQVIRINYDPITGATGSIDNSLEEALDRMTAEETFKLEVVRRGVFPN